MSQTTYNIESEKRFLSLFDCEAVGPDPFGCWIIMNEQGQVVGQIERKQMANSNYGYHMQINISSMNYSDIRLENDEQFSYHFNMTKENGETIHVKLNMGKNPNISIFSASDSMIQFYINGSTMCFTLPSNDDNYKIRETVVMQGRNPYSEDFGKLYSYSRKFCDKKKDLHILKETVELKLEYLNKSIDNQIHVKTILSSYESTIEENFSETGTIEESIIKNELGLSVFLRLRGILNQILPTKEEILAVMLEERGITEPEFAIFMPDISMGNEETLKQRRKLKGEK